MPTAGYPTAGSPDEMKAAKELGKIANYVPKIYEKSSHDEKRTMFILGASADLKRQPGVKMYMRDHNYLGETVSTETI